MITYKKEDKFKNNVSILDVYNLYKFDKKLRNLFLEMLESVVVAFRTHITYLISGA